ncbi:hypothetical protein M5D96_013952 [Drosophila gunungcola]|uniref:Uncharacterized protein n=1 Tax=Drosophila gunungcola TaxID=103775 RepID=A0A9P9YAF4_9MUSC|nr:hypothetical protein M5D96_013952 [Drosophila gunungcola]
MSKLSVVLLIATVVVAIEATSVVRPNRCWDRCTLKDLQDPRLICVRDRATNSCTKLRPCRLPERNCIRRNAGKELLRETCLSQCRWIPGGSSASGPCAPKKRPVIKV